MKFTDDAVDNIISDPSAFADDTALMKAIGSDGDVLIANNDLATLCDWAALWRVMFNAKKTVYVISKKSRSDDVSRYLNGEKIKKDKIILLLRLMALRNNVLGRAY